MRRAALPFYALVFLTAIVWMAIVPLAPSYAHAFSLSRFAIGALLAAGGFATLVVSLPIGLLTDRFGARTLVIASSAIATVSTLGQGLATDFWMLLLSRAAFGVALGAIWTAGLAWFAEADATPESISSLGFPTTISGIGIVIGPAFAGLIAGASNVHVPFLILGGFCALLTVALAGTPRLAPSRYGREPIRTTLGKARRDAVLLGSLVVMVVVGLTSGGVNLLVPLQLRSDGLSVGGIGVVMSASSLVFVVCSGLVAGRARLVNLRFVAFAVLAYAATLVLAAASASAPSILTFVLVRAPFWAVLSTLSYPLGALGARRAAAGPGAVNGLLNLVWGAAGSAGPLAAGAVAHVAGPGWVFAALAALCGGVGAFLLAKAATDPMPALTAGVPGS